MTLFKPIQFPDEISITYNTAGALQAVGVIAPPQGTNEPAFAPPQQYQAPPQPQAELEQPTAPPPQQRIPSRAAVDIGDIDPAFIEQIQDPAAKERAIAAMQARKQAMYNPPQQAPTPQAVNPNAPPNLTPEQVQWLMAREQQRQQARRACSCST